MGSASSAHSAYDLGYGVKRFLSTDSIAASSLCRRPRPLWIIAMRPARSPGPLVPPDRLRRAPQLCHRMITGSRSLTEGARRRIVYHLVQVN